MKAKFAQLKQASLFEKEKTMTNLSALGNPLERLEQYIDFEMFRPMLEEIDYIYFFLKTANLFAHSKKM